MLLRSVFRLGSSCSRGFWCAPAAALAAEQSTCSCTLASWPPGHMVWPSSTATNTYTTSSQLLSTSQAEKERPAVRLVVRMSPHLEAKVSRIAQHCAVLEQQLHGSSQQHSGLQLQEIHREYKRVQLIGAKYTELQRIRQELDDTRSLAQSLAAAPAASPDGELRLLAEEEARQLGAQAQHVEQQLLLALLPSSQDEGRSAILEVRAGTGGDEAALFAANLLAMYRHYAEHKGWSCEMMEQSASDSGGFKFVSAAFSGPGAYSRLRHEAGVHRVQRVPATEREGRIHTSTASVVVMPDADETDLSIRDEDLKIEAHRASGAGGQSVNVTNSAVRITHLPSGLVVTCQDERSLARNKAKALRVLRARLFEAERSKQAAATSAERRASIGSGDRHERIRTYNFHQDRVTDHRVGISLHGLEDLLSGEAGASPLDSIIDALSMEEQTRQLEELSEA